jgi:hypothetical protein
MESHDEERGHNGATLSDKTARSEFGFADMREAFDDALVMPAVWR